MMRRVLITGARAPSALGLVKGLRKSGVEVYCADSFRYPLTRFSRYLARYYVVSSPAHCVQAYVSDLRKIIIDNDIDMLLPTCEEIFFISKHKDKLTINNCFVFCDDFEKLAKLHNKYQFIKMAALCDGDILSPMTQLLLTRDECLEGEGAAYVYKPVFSRFASKTLICPGSEAFGDIIISDQYPWVRQQYIQGEEYCSYSIAVGGQLQVHACYHPRYRAGQGSGIYLEPIHCESIFNFVSHFVKKYNFTGQIGFDYIRDSNNDIYVIECNPRATSGVHFLQDAQVWGKVLAGEFPGVLMSDARDRVIALAMMTFGVKYLFSEHRWRFLSDLFKAKDVIFSWSDLKPAFCQFISLGEILYKSIRTGQTFTQVATSDIEWNGEEI